MTTKNDTPELPPRMIVYAIAPIDFWPGWMHYREYVASLSRHYELFDVVTLVQEFSDFLYEARRLAQHAGWEGNTRDRDAFFVAALPAVSGASEPDFLIG